MRNLDNNELLEGSHIHIHIQIDNRREASEGKRALLGIQKMPNSPHRKQARHPKPPGGH